MDSRKFQQIRWLLRFVNLLLIAGLIVLIVENCHPVPWWLIALLSVTGLIILLTGRVWCAYACPVGLSLDLLTALFIVRFWCSFCPCGLFFGWLNKISPLKLEKDSSKCLSCGLCSKQCPMQSKRISIQKNDGEVFSPECMMCGECIGKCPASGAVRLTLFGKTLTESGRLNNRE